MNWIAKFLNPPQSTYTNYYKQANYVVSWKVQSFMVLALVPTIIAYYFFDFTAFFPSLYAFVTSVLILYWFSKKKDYMLCGSVYVVHAVLFLGVELLIKKDTLHLIEFPWFFVFSLYALLVLGKKIGAVIFGISFFFIIVYSLFFFKENMTFILDGITEMHLTVVILNLLMGAAIMTFLVIEFKTTRKYAEQKYQNANIELKEKNRLIEAQNDEKTAMLKEIHHRVKNNLQVVSSLVRLQSFETKDEKAKKMFESTVSRIVAMALIHEKMYQNDNLSKINLENYLHSLATDILRANNIDKEVKFSIKSELEIIGNRAIVPLALIFNELISNSLKHAFLNNSVKTKVCQIKSIIKKTKNEMFTIQYQDNGLWVDTKKESSFGLELIETFTEQLEGEVSRSSTSEGTTYIFKLKNID